ncbi:MAG: phage virion morphogenesis protein [Kiritimatiellae bacterium]|nr:phage virion morphogenesis protein [Kiritimatiellia bacterium]
MKLTVSIDAKNLEGRLADLRAKLDDCSDGMQLVGEEMVGDARKAFTENDWDPITEAAIESRKRRRLKDKLAAWREGGMKGKKPSIKDVTVATAPLKDSGDLSRSLRVVETGKDFVTVGSDRSTDTEKSPVYSIAAIHQFGTKDGRIPARPFFPIDGNGFTESVRKTIVRLFGTWLMRQK